MRIRCELFLSGNGVELCADIGESALSKAIEEYVENTNLIVQNLQSEATILTQEIAKYARNTSLAVQKIDEHMQDTNLALQELRDEASTQKANADCEWIDFEVF